MSKKAASKATAYELDHNYASDKVFAEELMTNLLDIFKSVVSGRESRETVWQQSYRAWSIDNEGVDRNYNGMADLKIPQLRKEVETMSRRIYKGLLPDDYLKAEPATGFLDPSLIATNTQVVRHYYDNVMKIKSEVLPWVKQKVLYGTSPIRQYWCKTTNELFFKKRIAYTADDGTIKFKVQPVKEDVVMYNAPVLRAEDLFNTWVYPHNAKTAKDIEITIYRTMVKKFDLEKKVREKTCVRFDEIKDMAASAPVDFEEAQVRLAQFGDPGAYKPLQGNDYYELLEFWCQLVLPGSDKPVSCVVEVVNKGICTRIQRNPYWHQESPFDWGRFIIPPPGEFYGRGLPEAAMSLQLQLDDTMNQTMDATTLALNNITIINPAYAPNADSFEIEPGATWWADPNAVKQFQFPDLTDSGYKAAGTLRNWISELSDNQPQLPDPIAGKARSTGQAQLAVNEWQTDLFCFIDFLSVEALSSMAHKTHALLQQYLGEDDVIRVSGKYAGTWIDKVVTPDDICGRYDFKWIGALQIESQAIKTQQMIQLLQIWKNLPPDAQQQVRMIWPNYIIKLLRDGFLIKDVDNVIETDKMTQSVEPDLEARIIKLGGDITVQKTDNDDVHIASHEREYSKETDVLKRAYWSKHLDMHRKQREEKIAEVKRVQMQMQIAQMQQQGAAPGGQGGSPGNPTQINTPTDPADLNRGLKVET